MVHAGMAPRPPSPLPPPPVPPPPPAPPPPADLSYRGCFVEVANYLYGTTLYDTGYQLRAGMTAANCYALALEYQYRYFIMGPSDFGSTCYLGDEVKAMAAAAAASACTSPCSGNSVELCGGAGAVSMYEVIGEQERGRGRGSRACTQPLHGAGE